MKLHVDCVICKQRKNLVGIGTFARCCDACATELHDKDMAKLKEYSNRARHMRPRAEGETLPDAMLAVRESSGK